MVVRIEIGEGIPRKVWDAYTEHQGCVTKQQICREYKISKNTIGRWINRHLDKFQAIGYEKQQQKLTPLQMKLFEEIFGKA